MDFIQVVFLSLVQGITELLPVSSSAHLILVPLLTNWPDQEIAFDIALHVGTLLAVIIYFKQDLVNMAVDGVKFLTKGNHTQHSYLLMALIFGTIPVGLAGLLFKDYINEFLRSPNVIAWTTIIFGLLLLFADKLGKGERSERNLQVKDVVLVGFAQVLALIPGVSRSGITITAGLMTGISREGAARFSFLLSIPVIILAGGLQAYQLLSLDKNILVDWTSIFIGIFLSGITAYICMHYFLKMITKIGFEIFVGYRVVLGIVLLWVF